MPTLFISYKRDDKVAVLKITDRLRKDFYFSIWIDVVSIPGGEDWRAEIRKGIDKADVVLLMLTPDACASPQVKEEVDYAKSVGRRILPLQIKRVSNDDLEELGVEHLNYIDFNTSHDDRFAWEKLLNDLPDVLERDKRLLDPQSKALHQDYLRSLFTRYGKLSLSYLLDATPKEQVSLFDVYVPLKLGVSFNIEVTDGEFADWWMRDQNTETRAENTNELRETPKPKALNGFSPGGVAWSAWENQMRQAWATFKARHEEEQAKKDEKEREQLEDGTYRWNRIESEVAPALMSHIVITGAPGSGKSTLLKHLALCMAGDMLFSGDEAEADLNRLGFWPLPAYTPIFVELRALVRTAFPDPKTAVTLEKFFSYIEAEQLRPHGIGSYLDDLRAQLRAGDAMIFLDGLDEVPEADTTERREQIKTLAHLLSQQYPDCRICITSRPYAYAGDWQLDGFGQVTLVNLDPDRLEELALRLFRVVLGQEGAEQEAESFKEQMKNVPQELRGSPLFFTLMASIWLNNTMKPAAERLPVSKDDIYRECVEMLIRRWTRKDAVSGQSMLDDIGLSEGDLRRVLQALAYHVHSEAGESDDAEFTGGKILDIVETLKLRRVDIYALRDALAQRAGVIYERAPNRYQYAHRSFQEHLAACYLTEAGRYPQVIANHVRHQPGLWRNVMDLLPSEAGWQKRDLWQLVKVLLPEKDSALPDTADDPVWNSIFHAARLMTAHLPAEDDLQDVYRPRLHKLLVRLVEIGALAPVDRAEMGRILSTLGDPRPGVGITQVTIDGKTVELPQIEWCDIPAPPDGVFMMGADDQSDNPRREVELKYSFKMSKYLVTYQQFQAFVDSGEYDHPDWWNDFPPEYKQQEMAEQNNAYDNHPRDRISWYQAVAFTRWLTARLRQAGLLEESVEIRLPTEREWEFAARGTDERKYPYSGDFDPRKGNTDETGIGRTSAVGLFPEGASPFGVFDMSGNLWEWCLNNYNNPDVTEGYGNGERKVLRGGSFYSVQDLAAASSRYDFNPNRRNYDVGFRLVLGAPVASLPSGTLNSESE